MTAAAVSPLAPAGFPALPPIAGVRLAAFAAGIRYTGRDDLMLVELAPAAPSPACSPARLTAGRAGDWCRECLPGGKVRAIVVNSGNANVFTGRAGAAGRSRAPRRRRQSWSAATRTRCSSPRPA